MPAALRPLRHRDFRLLWAGLAVSLTGSGLWLVALAWQVISLGVGPPSFRSSPPFTASAYSRSCWWAGSPLCFSPSRRY